MIGKRWLTSVFMISHSANNFRYLEFQNYLQNKEMINVELGPIFPILY